MIELQTVARGSDSRIAEPMHRIVRSVDEWRSVWALHAGPESAAPEIDFSRRIVAVAFAGERPSAGFTIEIAASHHDGGALVLTVREQSPPRGSVAAQILSSPFHVVTLNRTDGEVRWAESPTAEGSGRMPGVRGPAVGASLGSQSGSSTGLSPRTAAMLAYLAGPFSGVLILLAESQNGDVRFHAWQSIVALGALAVAVALAYGAAVLSLFISATAVSLIVRIATGIFLVLLVVWAICLWKAFAGGRWKLPLAGGWAERIATRRIS